MKTPNQLVSRVFETEDRNPHQRPFSSSGPSDGLLPGIADLHRVRSAGACEDPPRAKAIDVLWTIWIGCSTPSQTKLDRKIG